MSLAPRLSVLERQFLNRLPVNASPVFSVFKRRATPVSSSRVQNARRDALVLTILITAVLLLIWNGSAFFSHLRFASGLDSEVRVASTALTLNVALILFGWRRYVDLQHEAELREEQERRAAVLATTDPVTGLLQPQGVRGRGRRSRDSAASRQGAASSSCRCRCSDSRRSTSNTDTRPVTGCSKALRRH